MRLYMDLVVALNFMVDFLLLLGTNRLTGHPQGGKRAALAASVGGVYGGVCMVPGVAFLGNSVWRLVSLGLMAWIAFGWDRSAVQRGAVFVLLSMALGGLALGLTRRTFWMLVIAAGVLWLLCRAGFRGSVGGRTYVEVKISGVRGMLTLTALQDTGNTLRDPLTGEQVLVAGADVAWELLGLTREQLEDPVGALGDIPGLRLIPYRAVGQPGGMLLARRFENVWIGKKHCAPLVAFAPHVLAAGAEYRMLTGGVV